MMPESFSKSFVVDNAIVLAGHILVYLKGFILMPIIVKTGGIKTYGGFVLFASILSIILGISSFGAGVRAKRFLPSATDMAVRRQLFYPQFLFGFFSIISFSILLVIANKQISLYLFKNELSYSALLIPAYLVSYFLYSQGSDYFRYTSRIHLMTAASLCFPYIYIGIILLCWYLFEQISINSLVLSHTVSAFLVAIPCFWVLFREIGFKYSFYKFNDLISDIRIGFPIVLGFIVDFVLAASDRYLLAFYMTVPVVGYYNTGYVLGSAIIFIPKAMGTVLPQLMSKAVDSDKEHEAQRMLNYALKFFLLLAIPFIFGSVVLGEPLLTLLTNEEVAAHADLVTPIVALGTLFYGLNTILTNVLFVRLKTRAIFKMNFLAAVFNLLANVILLFFFRNILTAALTTCLSYFIAFIYINKIAREDWPVDFQMVTIFKSIISSFLMLFLLVVMSLMSGGINSVGMFALNLTIGILFYFIGLFIFGAFSKEELKFAKSFF